jgi:hypothetical protein
LSQAFSRPGHQTDKLSRQFRGRYGLKVVISDDRRIKSVKRSHQSFSRSDRPATG